MSIIYGGWHVGGGGGRNIRVMGGGTQSGGSGGFGSVGMGSAAFASAATFPHYAIQQGIPYNLYGYVYLFSYHRSNMRARGLPTHLNVKM